MSAVRRRSYRSAGLYEYTVPRGKHPVYCSTHAVRRNKRTGNNEQSKRALRRSVGPRGLSDINTFHYSRQWPAEWTSSSWWALSHPHFDGRILHERTYSTYSRRTSPHSSPYNLILDDLGPKKIVHLCFLKVKTCPTGPHFDRLRLFSRLDRCIFSLSVL